jgi:hypothetical protein
MKLLVILFILIGFLVRSQPEIKCLCSMDPTPSGAMISHIHKKREWMFSYKYMRMNMDGNISGTSNVDDNFIFNDYLGAPKQMNMDMHMLMGMYGLSDRLTGMIMFNYLNNFMTMEMLPTDLNSGHAGHSHSLSGDHEMKTNGFGDVQLGLLYGLLMKGEHQLIVSTELNLPTGSVDKKGPIGDMMYNDKRYPYAMQIGTGTFDLKPKITYLFEKGEGTFSVQGGVNIPLSSNDLGYRRSKQLEFSSWYAYKLGDKFTTSLRSVFSYSENLIGSDEILYRYTEPSANILNYGRTSLNAFWGGTFHFWSGNRIAFELGLPIYQNALGIQMKDKVQINLSYNIKI